jgi:hypothetical protein
VDDQVRLRIEGPLEPADAKELSGVRDVAGEATKAPVARALDVFARRLRHGPEERVELHDGHALELRGVAGAQQVQDEPSRDLRVVAGPRVPEVPQQRVLEIHAHLVRHDRQLAARQIEEAREVPLVH